MHCFKTSAAAVRDNMFSTLSASNDKLSGETSLDNLNQQMNVLTVIANEPTQIDKKNIGSKHRIIYLFQPNLILE